MKLACLVSVALAVGCASGSPGAGAPPVGDVEPSNLTVITETLPTLAGQAIYAVNNSSVPITVTSVWLRDCQNVADPCVHHPLHILVKPRNRQRIAMVRAANQEDGFSYNFSWTWSASPSP